MSPLIVLAAERYIIWAMLKNLGPKRTFILLLLLIHLVVLPGLTAITYLIVKESAIRDAYTAGRLYLSTVSAMKHYVAEELRPIFYRELPGRFIVEGMSRSYVASQVTERVRDEMSGYNYKNASLHPKSRLNSADEFEAKIIRRFIDNPAQKEWTGYRDRGDDRFYVIARPGQPFADDCLRCHGDPGDAPKELIERYGAEAGFHMKAGQLADATFVYIPISVPIASARTVVLLFIVLYGLFGTAILLIINSRFSKLYDTIETDRKRIEDINMELINLNQDIESIIAERTMNLIALSVADRVRNPAFAIAGTINRLLKKEDLAEQVKERLSSLLSESRKLDDIVKEYETILRTRHTKFQMENVNELLESVLPLVEDERADRQAVLSVRLADQPLQCMANRQLFRIAVLHVLRNAIEAVEQGGEITVSILPEGDRVTISITDNGSGIAPEELPKIFEAFYSTKRKRMGMGLPVARQIVAEHKGAITVESGQGQGTTFRITLPRRWNEKELSS